jgi:hypothetical protein
MIKLGPPPTPNRQKYPFAGSLIFQGMPIYVENPKGSTRSGVGKDGKKWSVTMAHHYGEFAETLGSDRDPLDVFVGPNPAARTVYVVRQVGLDRKFDELKVMVGFDSASEAKEGYLANYDRPDFYGGMTAWPIPKFKEWLRRRGPRKDVGRMTDGVRDRLVLPEGEKMDKGNTRITTGQGDVGGYGFGHDAKGASSSAPNYRPSAGLGCASCRFLLGSECLAYGREVSPEYVCDSWVSILSTGADLRPDPPGVATAAAIETEDLRQAGEVLKSGLDQAQELAEEILQWSPSIDKATTSTTVRAAVPEDLEGAVSAIDYLPGGLASGRPDSDFDSDDLAQGAKVEAEHTDDPRVAREIAKDHLAEDKDYYRKLAKMEGKGKGGDEKKATGKPVILMRRLVKAVTPGVRDRILLRKAMGGPYIGPRGGKWADPEHTISWKESRRKPRQKTFDAWFRGSKITEPNGEPKAVYHGTARDFDQFDESERGTNTEASGAEQGFFFAGSEADSHFYAEMSADKTVGTARVMRAYLRAENPLVLGMDEASSNVSAAVLDRIRDADPIALKYAKEHGYDAVVWPHGNPNNSDYTVVVFNSEQVWIDKKKIQEPDDIRQKAAFFLEKRMKNPPPEAVSSWAGGYRAARRGLSLDDSDKAKWPDQRSWIAGHYRWMQEQESAKWMKKGSTAELKAMGGPYLGAEDVHPVGMNGKAVTTLAKGKRAEGEIVLRRALEYAVERKDAEEVDRFRSPWEQEAEAAGRELLAEGQEAEFDALMDNRDELAGRLTAEDLRRHLGQVELVAKDGTQFRSGTPVTFKYARPLEADQSRFGSELQPAGVYLFHLVDFGGMKGPGWDTGELSFCNPLVIEWVAATGEPQGWRARLSHHWDDKRGKDLSRAIRVAGYDGVVTVRSPWRECGEIIDLRRTVDWANVAPTRVLMRLGAAFRLALAEQMGLFGRPKPAAPKEEPKPEPKTEPEKPSEPPAAGKHIEQVHVQAHVAKTEHGLVQVKAHERKVEKRVSDLSSRKIHHDVGEVVGGARKHKYHHIDLSNLDQLEAEGEVEAARRVTKAAALGTIDLDDLRANGDTPGAAFLKREFYKTIPAKPEPTVKARRDYIRACDYIRRGLDQCHTLTETRQWIDSFASMARGYKEAPRLTGEEALAKLGVKPGEDEDYGGGGWQSIADTRVARSTLVKHGIEEVLHDSEPIYGARGYEGSRNWYRLLTKDESMQDTYGSMAEAIGADVSYQLGYYLYRRRGKVLKPITKALAGQWDAFEQAARYEKNPDEAWEKLGAKKERGGGGGTRWVRQSSVEGITRTGGPEIPARITGDELMSKFGFRAVQYGNWVDDKDAAKHLAHCYGALVDLADILGLDPKMIAHSGALAMAFGARGSGRFAAHYEADKKVINLTHTCGDGSLAHEWGHFMDHILTGSDKWIPEGKGLRAPFLTHGEGHDQLHSEVAKAMRGVVDAMKFSDDAGADYQEAKARHSATYNELVQSSREPWFRGTPAGWTDEQRRAKIDDYNAKVKQWRADQKRLKTMRGYGGRTSSKFAADAAGLGDYWARTHEMFARAFESYVQDKIEGAGRKSTYLVDGTRASYSMKRKEQTNLEPYPQGKDRERINAAMDTFFAAMRTHGALRKALMRILIRNLNKAEAHVKEHFRALPSGKVVLVKEHERKYEEAAEEGKGWEVAKSEIVEAKVKTELKTDAARVWNLYAHSTYGSADLVAVATREALQNSADACRRAVAEGQVSQGRFDVNFDERTGTITFEDNGIGMDHETLHKVFLTLGGTGKAAESGAAGGFGVAKAVILGCSPTANWEIHSRDNFIPSSHLGQEVAVSEQKRERRQGTKITVRGFKDEDGYQDVTRFDSKTKEYQHLSKRLEEMLSTTNLSDLDLFVNGKKVQPAFRGAGSPVSAPQVNWGPGVNSVKLRKYRRDITKGNGSYYVRIGGLFQCRIEPSYGVKMPFDVTIDLKPSVRPGHPDYPLVISREGFAASAEPGFHDLRKELEQEASSETREYDMYEPESDDIGRAGHEPFAEELEKFFQDPETEKLLGGLYGRIDDVRGQDFARGYTDTLKGTEAEFESTAQGGELPPEGGIDQPRSRQVDQSGEPGEPGEPGTREYRVVKPGRGTARLHEDDAAAIVRYLTERGVSIPREWFAGGAGEATPGEEKPPTLDRLSPDELRKIQDQLVQKLRDPSGQGARQVEQVLKESEKKNWEPGGTGLAGQADTAKAYEAAHRLSEGKVKKPKNPFGNAACVQVSRSQYSKSKARRFLKNPGKAMPMLIAWDATCRMISKEYGVGKDFKPGFCLDDGARAMAASNGDWGNKRRYLMIHPDRLQETIAAHKGKPDAARNVALYLHTLAAHELAHFAGAMNHGEEFVKVREDLAIKTAHLLPAIELAVRKTLGIKEEPTAEQKQIAKLQAQVERMKAKQTKDRRQTKAIRTRLVTPEVEKAPPPKPPIRAEEGSILRPPTKGTQVGLFKGRKGKVHDGRTGIHGCNERPTHLRSLSIDRWFARADRVDRARRVGGGADRAGIAGLSRDPECARAGLPGGDGGDRTLTLGSNQRVFIRRVPKR